MLHKMNNFANIYVSELLNPALKYQTVMSRDNYLFVKRSIKLTQILLITSYITMYIEIFLQLSMINTDLLNWNQYLVMGGCCYTLYYIVHITCKCYAQSQIIFSQMISQMFTNTQRRVCVSQCNACIACLRTHRGEYVCPSAMLVQHVY